MPSGRGRWLCTASVINGWCRHWICCAPRCVTFSRSEPSWSKRLHNARRRDQIFLEDKMAAQKDKLTLIVLSDDLDKVFASFMIATGAAASGMEVIMFFTFCGLKAIETVNLTGKGLFGRMV